MAIGNPINLTSNVEGKNISVIATAGQTQFTVTGGYRINQISVFRNGVRLVDGRDYTALDGSIVTLLSAATVADVLEFQVFDDFRVSDALNVNSGGTVNGNVTVTGILSTTNLSIGSSISLDATSGIVTAVQFVGSVDATGLTGTPDITVNNIVAAAATFSGEVTYEDVTNIDSIGVITARDNIVVADKIIHLSDTNTSIRFPSNDTFTVETSGTERLRVDSSGDVGLVGIATATGLVVVAGSGIYAGHTGIITAVTFDGNVTGAVTGNADTATTSTNVTVADESSDTTCFPLFTTAATGNLPPKSGTNLTFNSSTGALTASSFVGALTGNQSGGSISATTGAFSGVVTLENNLDMQDNDKILLGSGDDFEIFHDGSNSIINDGGTGNLLLQAAGNTKLTTNTLGIDVTGHVETDTLNVSGISTFVGVVNLNANLDMQDNDKILIGTGDDLQIYHDGTNTIIENTTGNLYILDNDAVILGSASGTESYFKGVKDGAAELYFDNTKKLETTSAGLIIHEDTDKTISFTGGIGEIGSVTGFQASNTAGSALTEFGIRATDIRFAAGSSESARIDSSGRLLVGHTANINNKLMQITTSNGAALGLLNYQATDDGPEVTFIKSRNGTKGSHTVVNNGDFLGRIFFRGSDGDSYERGVEIAAQVDGTPGDGDMPGRLLISTTADGASTPTERLRITSAGLVRVPDNGKFTAGAGDDLQIYHDGSHSYIKNGTGNLYFQHGGENMAQFTSDGNVELYHDNSKKFQTTATGIDVTGAVTDSIGSLRRLGTSNVGSSRDLTTSDTGKFLRINAQSVALAVPSGTFTAGDMITFFNVSTGDMTVTSSAVTMYNSADGDTGNTRTIAAKGMATLLCTSSNEFVISGTQLS